MVRDLPCTESLFPRLQLFQVLVGNALGIGFGSLIRVGPKAGHCIQKSDHGLTLAFLGQFPSQSKIGTE